MGFIWVGAGVHLRKDIVSVLKDGTCGFVVSSSVVKARNLGKVLRELIG